MFTGSTINSIANLAKAVGVSGAALLILSLGVAYHLPKLAATLRQIVKDWHDHTRKSKELDHRIRRDSATLGLEIARKSAQVVKRIDRKASK
jgi:hypothetical protein